MSYEEEKLRAEMEAELIHARRQVKRHREKLKFWEKKVEQLEQDMKEGRFPLPLR